jgi:hypothetical protein
VNFVPYRSGGTAAVLAAHHRAQKLVILSYHRFDLFKIPVTVLSGHGSIFSLVVSHSQLLTMTSLFAEPSADYH